MQTSHGAGSSPAQFTMVLQLIMHLFNRIGRSLRIWNRENTDQRELRFGPDGGGESESLESIVDSAQVMLRTYLMSTSSLVSSFTNFKLA